MAGRRVRFAWVKGHSGHELNEAADRLANGAATSWKAGVAPPPGPGFEGAVTSPPQEPLPGRYDEADLFSEL
jgi:ribonuclease HI